MIFLVSDMSLTEGNKFPLYKMYNILKKKKTTRKKKHVKTNK